MGRLLLATSNLENLHRAARDVCGRVRHTAWQHLKSELDAFELLPIRRLRRIQKQLREGTYRFSAKWGYAKRKSGGSRRGITVHNLNDRIVQRSLLNTIRSQKAELQARLGEIPRLLQTSTSFAGIPGRGVPEAIRLAYQSIRAGALAYAYSDMKDFFPCVPRHDVVELLRTNIDDTQFVDLFTAALETEIANRAEIETWSALFPLSEVGVAQGSLLSTLVGNLALRHFDARLNRPPLTTVRYLDDFLILAADLNLVAVGFAGAVEELAALGMTCYQPHDGSQKAALGLAADGFDFLGCHVHPDGVSPARRARRKLLRDIALALASAKRAIRQFQKTDERRRAEVAYSQTLVHIDKKVRGWGDAYRFVSNRVAFSQMDVEIDGMLNDFQQWFRRNERQTTDPRVRRRMRGISLLADTPPADGLSQTP
ncbi:MAG TPA: reverse transcriptase domain-containing protein [Pirellulales bacterium]|nr:reverse transcriptase domain-containing protein [Pirellulales bacterium]